MFLKCTNATHICDKSQYKEASFLEILRLKIHLLHCKLCKKHVANNSRLTKLVYKANPKTMSLEDKEALKRRLDTYIKNQQ